MRKLLILIFIILLLPATNIFAQQNTPIPQPPIKRNIETNTSAPNVDNITKQIEPQIEDNNLYKLRLFAKLSENGSLLSKGVVWRIFDASQIEGGQMALLFKSNEAQASFELKSGDYLVHGAYGNAQTSSSIQIRGAPLTKTIIFEAGALRLNAAISGDIPISPDKLSFSIFSNTDGNNSKKIIAKNIKADEIIYLNAGIYHVVSYFGDINAQVRADLRVEAGQITDATLYHNGAEIRFRLASEPNGKAIADVEWTVKDENGETIYSELGAFPSTILAQGDYSVIAKIGQKVYNRDFQVRPSPPREIELLTSVYQ